MKTFWAILASVLAVVLTGISSVSYAVGTIDVSVTGTSGMYLGITSSTAYLGQTFTAGASGLLDRVTVNIRRNDAVGNVYVDVWATSAGVPVAPALATATITQSSINTSNSDVAIDFGTPATLVSGTTYALVLRAPGAGVMTGMMSQTQLLWNLENTAIPGSVFTATGSGTTWNADTRYDFRFATYVSPAPVSTPSSSPSQSVSVAVDVPSLIATGSPDLRLVAVLPVLVMAGITLMFYGKRRRVSEGQKP